MTAEAKKRIHNPVTGKYYEVRQKSSKYGKKGQIKGLWSSAKNRSWKERYFIQPKIWFIDTNIIAHWILGSGGIIKNLCFSNDLSEEFADAYIRRYKPAINLIDEIFLKRKPDFKDEFYFTSLASNELFSAIRDEIRSIIFFKNGIPISGWRDSRNNPEIPEEIYLETYRITLESFDVLFKNHGITIIPEVSPWDEDQYWSILSSILFLVNNSKTQDSTILTTAILNCADYFITLDSPLIKSAKKMMFDNYKLKLLNPTEGLQELKKR